MLVITRHGDNVGSCAPPCLRRRTFRPALAFSSRVRRVGAEMQRRLRPQPSSPIFCLGVCTHVSLRIGENHRWPLIDLAQHADCASISACINEWHAALLSSVHERNVTISREICRTKKQNLQAGAQVFALRDPMLHKLSNFGLVFSHDFCKLSAGRCTSFCASRPSPRQTSSRGP